MISQYFQCIFLKFSVCLRPFCSSFNVFLSLLAGELSKRKMGKNCDESAKVMTYGDIDGPYTVRQSIGGNRRMKKNWW